MMNELKNALENVLSHLKEMDPRTAIKTLRTYGLNEINPYQRQLEIYGTRYWVLKSYNFFREVHRTLCEKEEKINRNPVKDYGIDVL